MADAQSTVNELVSELQKSATPRTLEEENNQREKDGLPKKVIHDGRVYYTEGKNLQVDPSNPELATAAEEQLSGRKLNDQERAEREAQMRRAVREREDVLVVTDTGRTTVRVLPANRDRFSDVLQPQPGPVIQQVNDRPIAQQVPELNTAKPSEFANSEVYRENTQPRLEDPAQNEAFRLGEAGNPVGNSQGSEPKKTEKAGNKGGGSKSNSEKKREAEQEKARQEQEEAERQNQNPAGNPEGDPNKTE